jgi:hypothetical protein
VVSWGRFTKTLISPRSLQPKAGRSSLALGSGDLLLTIQPEAEFRALQEARRREAEPGFKKRYAARAGIVGTL